MLILTGRSESRPCRCCGRTLVHYEGEAHTHPDNGSEPQWVPIWRTEQHDAPCGLPCYGAGVPVRVYKTGQYHDAGECPRCNPKEEESP